ncbi:hypothetical protein [Chryseobacterium indoltheticum]|uniref:hypothetical protein n=1 Tax=Chryseobacterium indoltheticum TaxID=254 RepID=UPI003F4929CA
MNEVHRQNEKENQANLLQRRKSQTTTNPAFESQTRISPVKTTTPYNVEILNEPDLQAARGESLIYLTEDF